MKVKKLNEKKIMRVRNANGCGNFGGLELVGDKMYGIKTKSGNKLSTIMEYPNFKQSGRKLHKFADCMGHGNDIAYHAGHLYVAPCGTYVTKVNVNNWNYAILQADSFISNIAYYQGNQFISIINSGNGTYTLAIIEEVDGRMVTRTTWNVVNPKFGKGYTISQGLGFSQKKKKIFAVFTQEGCHRNVILRSSVGATSPDYCLLSRKNSGKYEFEGISFTKAGKKVIGYNAPGGDGICMG